MSNSNLAFRKRALYTGLQPYLQDNELMDALILWESEYANQPTFSVRYFIAELQRRLDRQVNAKGMLVNVVSSLSRPDKELLPDPSPALDAYKKRRNIGTVASFTLPELEAFQIFVGKWLSRLPPEHKTRVLRYILDNLDRQKLAFDLKAHLEAWFVKPGKTIRLPYVDTRDLRKVTNLVYMAICREIGPVKSDELLAKTVEAIRNNGGAAYSEIYAKLL